MMQKHLISISKKSLALAAIGFALAGCGREEGTSLTPWGNSANGSCPAGTTLVAGYGCMYNGSSGSSGSFISATSCTSRQLSATRTELACWVYPAYYSGSAPNYPYLASAGSTSEAWTGPEVRVGDRVTLQGALRVGSAYFGSLFGDCKDERDAGSLMNASVGSSSLFTMPIGVEVTASSAGILKFGLSERHSCYEAGSLYVRIIRGQ